LDYEQAMLEFEAQHPEIPVIRFNGDELDFVKQQQDLSYILDTLSKHVFKRSPQL
ncbi:MAG: deoxynucleoside kinase, partial [Bacillus sp. (in: firmicutes)]